MATRKSWIHSGTPQNVEDLGRAANRLCWDKRGVHFKAKSGSKSTKKGPNFSNVEKCLAKDTNDMPAEKDDKETVAENARYTCISALLNLSSSDFLSSDRRQRSDTSTQRARVLTTTTRCWRRRTGSRSASAPPARLNGTSTRGSE